MSSGWVLVKAVSYLRVVSVAGCVSVLCMCTSLAYKFILAESANRNAAAAFM